MRRGALVVIAATWAGIGVLSSCTSEPAVVGDAFDAGSSPNDATVEATTDARADAASDARADPDADASSDADADASNTYVCAVDGSADDDPVCDQCVRTHCCEWIAKCDASPSCSAARACIAACNPDDFVCITSCSTTAGSGGVFLQELGACVNAQCNAECSGDGGS